MILSITFMIYCYNFLMIGFGERLKELRIEHGLTQKELAEKLNIDPANITNWKKGVNLPSLEVFFELCKLLDVSADYLLGLTE